MKKTFDFGKKKQLFCDDYIVDTEKTTARFVLQKPVKREAVLRFDSPWEGDSTGYFSIVNDDNCYRLYYVTRDAMWKPVGSEKCQVVPCRVCYAQSNDGIVWDKPNLGICEFDGSNENNIILDETMDWVDNFFVFKDSNPDVPPQEKYKGLAASFMGADTVNDVKLWCYTSGDGLHFNKAFVVCENGTFDSLNTVVYNKSKGKYFCYFRDMHMASGEDLSDLSKEDYDEAIDKGTYIRDVRVMTSKDFRNWSDVERITYSSDIDYEMYTNGIFKYEDNDDLLVGLATRYTERKKTGESAKILKWTQCYDELPSPELRKKICFPRPNEDWHKRSGLAITDCVFMCSRDGYHFTRYDEAFLTPGPEKEKMWFYGNCYPAIGFVESASSDIGCENELSFFSGDFQRTGITVLYRYTIRKDGMVALKAGADYEKIVTKPFILRGNKLVINFASSGFGGLFIKLLDRNGSIIEGYESCEHYGNSTKRMIAFEKPLGALYGETVSMEITMRDCEIYSFKFEE